ncbi:Succinate--CoA ligase [GDP-forming] subunit beta, mitochondrial [Parelaphostrongylus tenuis]|uniref:Succinate--CoA ligase [GDP-forming] subunit beta, mitochondrial n=1 Tax=Parelaphostrongylus tenuis TaxID=148309 RepID=A0AAD5N3A8_PARTN|nr:Succinate--CoA ligase [GDP-forming] subunit beta, mitochondrial [Parelaphostrongylus tenuis]
MSYNIILACSLQCTIPLQACQKRLLNLQEYQSKELLSKHGCSVQKFIVAASKQEAEEKMEVFGKTEYVVKAQILAGGRGKGHFINGRSGLGGVFITTNRVEALKSVDDMVGKNLVTKQTSSNGVKVRKVMIAEGVPIKRETYVAVLMDQESNGPVIVVSPAGGMDIEEVANTTPNLIFKEPVDINVGVTDAQTLMIAENLKFSGQLATTAAKEIKRLYDLFIAVDATQIEINPFAETQDGRVFCIDAKMNFDDSAAFRQKEVFEMEDWSEQDARELEAHKHRLNYIGMEGNIACLVNGAGLAMATMDIIKLKGGEPANFLDVGGSVTEEQVFHAFRIITGDPRVKCVLVNIFGGIVNCATIANGLVSACRKISLEVPLVVRLEGTNVVEARRILQHSRLPIITANNLSRSC